MLAGALAIALRLDNSGKLEGEVFIKVRSIAILEALAVMGFFVTVAGLPNKNTINLFHPMIVGSVGLKPAFTPLSGTDPVLSPGQFLARKEHGCDSSSNAGANAKSARYFSYLPLGGVRCAFASRD
jgi:hypothetical protein